MILTQTTALFVDAYRELNARKLFWVTIALNLVVIAIYASLGINEEGVSFLHWNFDNPGMNTNFISEELFYKLQFSSWGISIWLSWVATILAIISTASIMPDLVAGGSIETMVSKPISRVRLFLTKYATGLLFAVLQVLVFTVGCFLVIGVRGGAWEFGLFLAVPIVVVFFSYLFAVCALLGLVTRSGVASLLLTLVFWFLMFAINATDETLVGLREGAAERRDQILEQRANQEVQADRMIERMLESGQSFEDNEGNPITDHESRRRAVMPTLLTSDRRLEEAEEKIEDWRGWTTLVARVKTPLPKTAETIDLMSRHMLSTEDLARIMAREKGFEIDSEDEQSTMDLADPDVALRAQEAFRDRSVWWIVGTSLGFEAFLLAIGCVIFARRDF